MNEKNWAGDPAEKILPDNQAGSTVNKAEKAAGQSEAGMSENFRNTVSKNTRLPDDINSGTYPETEGQGNGSTESVIMEGSQESAAEGAWQQSGEKWVNGNGPQMEAEWYPDETAYREDFSPILQCRDLSCRFGRTMALDHVNLDIPRGRIIGLLGPNGSGKTTFMKIANGLLKPTSGELTIEGHRPGPETKRIVSYLPDRDYLPDWMKVQELLGLFEEFYDDFDRVRAAEMIHNLGIDEKSRLRSLSKGTKEKVQLILTMSRNAALYLLDEPIGGVDPAARDYILHTIISNYNPEGSVLITTHLIADIEQVLDIVLFIDRGQIVLNQSVDEIRQTYGKSVDRYFREVF